MHQIHTLGNLSPNKFHEIMIEKKIIQNQGIIKQ